MNTKSKGPERPGPPAERDHKRVPGKIVESRDLLSEQGELLITHEGRLYRLRRTRLGKLILTA